MNDDEIELELKASLELWDFYNWAKNEPEFAVLLTRYNDYLNKNKQALGNLKWQINILNLEMI